MNQKKKGRTMATDEERREEYRRNAMDEKCEECNGLGYLTVDSGGGGPAYACPDCEGEG